MPRLSAIALHSRLSSTLIPKDNTLFDSFVENHLAAHALAGLDVSFPFPAGYSTTIVPQLRTLFGAPYPSIQTPLGETFASVVENLSGGDRPMFEPSFRFSPTGGDFLLAQGVGSATGTRTNMDTVYQIDADPALSAE